MTAGAGVGFAGTACSPSAGILSAKDLIRAMAASGVVMVIFKLMFGVMMLVLLY
jgi:hypothetical protein